MTVGRSESSGKDDPTPRRKRPAGSKRSKTGAEIGAEMGAEPGSEKGSETPETGPQRSNESAKKGTAKGTAKGARGTRGAKNETAKEALKKRVKGGTRGRKGGNRLRRPDETIDPLGYRRLVEESTRRRPILFGDILPDIIAKYGLGRKLAIARFEETLKTILSDLFPHSPMREVRGDGGQNEKKGTDSGLFADSGDSGGESFGFFDEHSFRLVGFRSGTLQIEISNAPLLSEWTFYEGEILRRFQEALPNEKIRKIRLTLK